MVCFRRRCAFWLILIILMAVSAAGFAEGTAPSNPLCGGTADRDWSGDRVFLGSYEQDADESNGPEPILWRVLQAEPGRLLLLSEYALETRPFHARSESVTWETSDIRQWLNSVFLDAAFADRGNWQKAFVLDHETKASDNLFFGTVGGRDTVDRVFLMAWEDLQVEQYGFPPGFREHSDATGKDELFTKVCPATMCYPTLRAAQQNALITRSHSTRETPDKTDLDGFGSVYWILRTPGKADRYITYVSRWGRTTIDFLSPVDHSESTIRPAVLVDTSALNFLPLGEGLFCADVDERYLQECREALDYKAAIQEKLTNLPVRASEPVNPTDKSDIRDLANPVTGGGLGGRWEGDRVWFGQRGREPILWRVLRADDDSLLLLSEYGLEKHSFDEKKGTSVWSNSAVRTYLNKEMIGRIFSPAETAVLKTTVIRNEADPRYGTPCGEDTEDRIFLLSYQECASEEYGFSPGLPVQSNSRICYPFGDSHDTESAVFGKRDSAGNQIWNADRAVRWLLRTAGFTEGYIIDVDAHGDAYHHELSAVGKELWLRPAVIVDRTKVRLEQTDLGFPKLIPSE